MKRDEEGLMKVKGRNKNETDHNTISITLDINDIDKTRIIRKTDWNLRASSEKWQQFREELEKRREKATNIIKDPEKPIDNRYKKWYEEIENAARKTIGKTTYKLGGKERFLKVVTKLRSEK